MSDEWFQDQIAPDGIEEDGCDPSQAQALKDHFEDKTTPAQAAFAITRSIVNNGWTDQDKDQISALWTLLVNAIIDLDTVRRKKTINLLKIINGIELSADLITRVGKIQGGFGPEWQEEKDWQLWRERYPDAATREAYAPRYRKIAACEAEMVVEHVPDVPVSYGLVCIADALESSGVLDLEFPAVFEWVKIAGEYIKAAMGSKVKIFRTAIPRDLYRATDDPRSGPLDKERLDFWIGRLEEIAATRDSLDAETRGLVIASAEIMRSWISKE